MMHCGHLLSLALLDSENAIRTAADACIWVTCWTFHPLESERVFKENQSIRNFDTPLVAERARASFPTPIHKTASETCVLLHWRKIGFAFLLAQAERFPPAWITKGFFLRFLKICLSGSNENGFPRKLVPFANLWEICRKIPKTPTPQNIKSVINLINESHF